MPTNDSPDKWSFRNAEKGDEPFLWDMLFETLLAEDSSGDLTRESLSDPTLSKYVEDWGAVHDLGIVALGQAGNRIGAAWSRLLLGERKGFGYIDDRTPEIAIAVVKAQRGRGLGTELLKRLIALARERYPGLCLSVAPGNPARLLYGRLGFETVEVRDDHPVMHLEFDKL